MTPKNDELEVSKLNIKSVKKSKKRYKIWSMKADNLIILHFIYLYLKISSLNFKFYILDYP